jgi:peptidylprolyl isomerase
LRRVVPPETKEDDIGEKIVSIRIAADIPDGERATWEILDSGRPAFAAYAEARRNRPEAFFHFRADYLDVCQVPVPVRKKSAP